MCTIAGPVPAPLAGGPSAYGGLVPLRQAWEALAGDALVTHGLRWRGRGGALLLFGGAFGGWAIWLLMQ